MAPSPSRLESYINATIRYMKSVRSDEQLLTQRRQWFAVYLHKMDKLTDTQIKTAIIAFDGIFFNRALTEAGIIIEFGREIETVLREDGYGVVGTAQMTHTNTASIKVDVTSFMDGTVAISTNSNTSLAILETVLHELCHVFLSAFSDAQDRLWAGHGKHWQTLACSIEEHARCLQPNELHLGRAEGALEDIKLGHSLPFSEEEFLRFFGKNAELKAQLCS